MLSTVWPWAAETSGSSTWQMYCGSDQGTVVSSWRADSHDQGLQIVPCRWRCGATGRQLTVHCYYHHGKAATTTATTSTAAGPTPAHLHIVQVRLHQVVLLEQVALQQGEVQAAQVRH